MATSSTQTEKSHHRLLLFPAPFQGHINPMLQLATLLHSKGFSITIFHTNFNSPNTKNHPNFTFEPISDGLTQTQGPLDPNEFLELIYVLNTNCREPFHGRLGQILLEEEKKKGERIVCLITDVLWPCTQDVASHFNIPRVLMRTSGAAATLVISSLPILAQKGYFAIRDGEAPVHEFPPLRVKDLPVISSWSITDKFDQLGHYILNATASSSGLIYNTMDDLEPKELSKLRRDSTIFLFPIGPIYKHSKGPAMGLSPQDRSCMAWLDKQAPGSVLYVSFGSVATIEKTQLEEIAWGLANSKQPFLWAVRPGSVHGLEWVELPVGFEEKAGGRGLVVKWTPQIQVLAHPAVGGFWTHCGWNSTIESIGEGVPMLCWPCLWDQMVNARYVSHVWKVGVQLESVLERGEIERAIKALMVDKEGDEIRERMKELKETVKCSLMGGGSSSMALKSLIDLIRSL